MKRMQLLSSIAVLVVAMCSFAVGEEGSRKAIYEAKPSYPEMAKRMNLSGKVKVRLSIGADGSVVGATALSGHPVLAKSAVEAAKEWKYEKGSPESTVIEFNFATQQ